MPNPYLPFWEYIPDGEPRVFGDRVYIYGSHDIAGSVEFCDYVLKCWSAPVDNLNDWVCHGDIFRTMETVDHPADTDWTNKSNQLYAPDVVEKDGKYYLYAYIVNSIGCVAVSDKPEVPLSCCPNTNTPYPTRYAATAGLSIPECWLTMTAEHIFTAVICAHLWRR